MLRSAKIVAIATTALIGTPAASHARLIDTAPDAVTIKQDTTKAQPAPRKQLTRYGRKLRSARKSYLSHYTKAKHHHGVNAVGRNIGRWGVIEHGKVRDAKIVELRASEVRLASMLGVVTAAAPATAPTSPTGSPPVPSGGAMPPAYIAECESGGDPTAVSPDGRYRGKWQMDQSTWESAGGVGDPAAASEATQDAVAARLYAMRGTQPWGCA